MRKHKNSLFLSLIAVASASLFSCGPDAKSQLLQDLSIKDFSSYQGIGIGYKVDQEGEESPKARRLSPKAEQKTDDANCGLLGLDFEGKLSALSFLGENGEGTSAAGYRLTNYLVKYPFIWLGFEPVNGSFDYDYDREIGNFGGWTGDTEFFLFSLNTGKIYYDEKYPDERPLPNYLEATKFPLLFFGAFGGKNCLYGDTFRFTEEDNHLVVENFENIRLLEPDESGKSEGFGAFGNVDIYDNAITAKNYVFSNKSKSIKKYAEIRYGYDQKIYVKENESSPWQAIDEEGKEVDLSLQPNSFLTGPENRYADSNLFTERRIKEFDNVTYFAASKNIYGSYWETGEIRHSNGIVRVEWVEDSYVVTDVDVPGGLIYGDYVYYLDDGRISRSNYVTFEHELLLDGYIIASIWLDAFGRVNFRGTNEQLQTVVGFLNEDGTPNYDITNEGYSVSYIAPVN